MEIWQTIGLWNVLCEKHVQLLRHALICSLTAKTLTPSESLAVLTTKSPTRRNETPRSVEVPSECSRRMLQRQSCIVYGCWTTAYQLQTQQHRSALNLPLSAKSAVQNFVERSDIIVRNHLLKCGRGFQLGWWWDENHKQCVLICRKQFDGTPTAPKFGVYIDPKRMPRSPSVPERRAASLAVRCARMRTMEGVKCDPFDYTNKWVAGRAKFYTMVLAEMSRVMHIKGIRIPSCLTFGQASIENFMFPRTGKSRLTQNRMKLDWLWNNQTKLTQRVIDITWLHKDVVAA